MQYNVGGYDRLARIAAGLGILSAGFAFHTWWGGLGLMLLLTGMVGVCPGYSLLGFSSANAVGGCSCDSRC